jgi:hypothetical protein
VLVVGVTLTSAAGATLAPTLPLVLGVAEALGWSVPEA